MQELKFHGISMAGPAKDMYATGTWRCNIQRDMLRKVRHAASCLLYGFLHGLHMIRTWLGDVPPEISKVPMDLVEVPIKQDPGQGVVVFKNLDTIPTQQ